MIPPAPFDDDGGDYVLVRTANPEFSPVNLPRHRFKSALILGSKDAERVFNQMPEHRGGPWIGGLHGLVPGHQGEKAAYVTVYNWAAEKTWNELNAAK